MKTCPQCHLTYPSDSTFCFVDGSSLLAIKDPRIGTTLAGRYVIEAELGVGGMAAVYRAKHRLVEQRCAIKILNPQFAMDPVLRERFVREAKHAQRLAHPNIIEIFDQGDTEDGTPYLVMELLEGESLADVLDRTPLPMARALPIAIDMARALARAHDFEVIHRDLKPENVFILPGDRVKLLDFGIARCAQDARLTNLGEIFGTPEYMAPERGSSIDSGPPADLYAFGILVFEMLTHRLPFEAKDPATWLMKHLRETPPHLLEFLPDAPEALDRLIFALMAKNPADRPVDAHRVKLALTTICLDLGIPVPAEPTAQAGPLSSSPRSGDDPWQKRIGLFEKMLGLGFPGGPPPDLRVTLDLIKAHLRDEQALRKAAFEEQEKLEAVEHQGREGRLRLGRAMDALTSDASTTREEARALRIRVAAMHAESRAFAPRAISAHREVVIWEGRSGFAEPYAELSAAYRRQADLIDAWQTVRRHELATESEAIKLERVIADVDFQIRALRESLDNLDRTLETRRRTSQEKITELGRRTQQLDRELYQLATRFCAPLRARPELARLFVELEQPAT